MAAAAGHARWSARVVLAAEGAGRVITRDGRGGGVRAAAAWDPGGGDWRDRRRRFQRVTRGGLPEGLISYRYDNGAWLNAARDHVPALARPAHSPGWKLGHYGKDGIEVIDAGGELDIHGALRLRELLIDLASKNADAEAPWRNGPVI